MARSSLVYAAFPGKIMAKTSLKAYLDYIEDRLNRDAYPEVISHCRHVLEQYPRNLEAYRLLVRALISQKNYTDGFDLCQRILSANPNDFIAHISISECYRESGSINQALWHLERAYEQAPSNQNLQEEIRSLYVAKGLQPPRKMRLTSGALARLYARGRLFPQAIKELEKAIAADQERLDLQALLASVLWESRFEIRAGRMAAEVYKRLPFSIDANRILGLMWLNVGNPEEAQPFIERVREMDPYIAYEIENNGQKAPLDVATLERLDYEIERGRSHSDSADWVSEINPIEVTESPITPQRPGDPFIEPASSSNPEWLEKALNAPVAGSGPGIQRIEDIYQSGITPSYETIEGSVKTGQTGWLDDMFNRGTRVAAPSGSILKPSQESEAPDWLRDALKDEKAPSTLSDDVPEASAASAVGDTIDWLSDIVGSETSNQPYAVPGEATGGTTPLWLKEAIREQKQKSPSQEAQESTEWLQNLMAESGDSTSFGPIPTPPEAIDREAFNAAWEAEYGGETQTPSQEEPAPEFGGINTDSLPEWLNDPLGLEKIDDQEEDKEILPDMSVTDEPLPQWVMDLEKKSAPDEGIPTRPLNEPASAADNAEHPLIDIIATPDDIEQSEGIKENIIMSAPYDDFDNDDEEPKKLDIDWDSEEDAMSWLNDLASNLDPTYSSSEPVVGSGPDEPFDLDALLGDEVSQSDSTAHASDMPDWLNEPADATSETVADEDDPFAWLNEETSKQGIDNSMPVSESLSPELPSAAGIPTSPGMKAAQVADDELPEWLKDFEEKGPSIESVKSDLPIEEDELAWLDESLSNAPRIDTDELSAIFDMEEPDEKPREQVVASSDEEIPDWLFETTGVAVEKETIKADMPLDESGDLPDWLKEIESPQDQPPASIIVEEAAPELTLAQDEDLPAWLNKQTSAETPDQEALPDWMKEDTQEEAELYEPVAEIASDEESLDDLPDWLKGPAQDIESSVPEVSDDLPDWMKTSFDEAPITATAGTVEEIPEWMTPPVDEETLPIREGIETPDWLSSSEKEVPAAEEAEEELPAWLRETAESEEDSTPEWLREPTSAEPTVEGVEEVPAWMKEPVFAQEEDEETEEDIPEWLKETSEPAEEEPALASSAADIPDWMLELEEELEAGVGEEIKTAPVPEPATDIPSHDGEPEEDIPAWMKELQSADESLEEVASTLEPMTEVWQTEEDQEAETAGEADEDLDWLREIAAPAEVTSEAAAIVSEPEEEVSLTDALGPTGAEATPDWLSELEREEEWADLVQPPAEEPAAEPMPRADAVPEQPVAFEDIEEEVPAPVTEVSEPIDAEAESLLPEGEEDLSWLKEEVHEIAPTTAAEAGVSDWLEGVEEEEEPVPEAILPEVTEPELPVIEETDTEELIMPLATEMEALTEEVIEEEIPVASEPEPITTVQHVAEPIARDRGIADWLKPGETKEPAPAATEAPEPETIVPGRPVTTSIFTHTETPEPSEGEELLPEARKLMAEGSKVDSLNMYEKIVEKGDELDAVIDDMRSLVEKGPVKPQVYRLLGDALMAKGELQEALKMYHNALEHL